MTIPHFQFTSRNLEQLEFALRYRLLGARSPSPEVRQEAEAGALILLLPFAHLGGRIQRRIATHFQALEEGAARVAGDRARVWLPLMRALYEMVSGRPDRSIAWWDEFSDAAHRQGGLPGAAAAERALPRRRVRQVRQRRVALGARIAPRR